MDVSENSLCHTPVAFYVKEQKLYPEGLRVPTCLIYIVGNWKVEPLCFFFVSVAEPSGFPLPRGHVRATRQPAYQTSTHNGRFPLPFPKLRALGSLPALAKLPMSQNHHPPPHQAFTDLFKKAVPPPHFDPYHRVQLAWPQAAGTENKQDILCNKDEPRTPTPCFKASVHPGDPVELNGT